MRGDRGQFCAGISSNYDDEDQENMATMMIMRVLCSGISSNYDDEDLENMATMMRVLCSGRRRRGGRRRPIQSTTEELNF